ncbi:MAG: membrane-binding protein [Capnocytophaga sp.]|nr:membrane-binding protein [Capnocytophaga sp.]
MAKKSFAETIASSQLLSKALEGRLGNLPIGVTTELVDEIKKLNQQVLELNVEQEKLKADLKEKTAQYESVVKVLQEKQALAKKYIKLSVPKELWREFGFEDKR